MNHTETERLRTISVIIAHRSTVGWLLLLVLVRLGWAFLWLERDKERQRNGATFALNLPHSHESEVLLAGNTPPNNISLGDPKQITGGLSLQCLIYINEGVSK